MALTMRAREEAKSAPSFSESLMPNLNGVKAAVDHVMEKSHFPAGQSDERIAALQRRQLEEDAIHFTQNHPQLAPFLPRWLGAEAVAGAAAFQQVMKSASEKKPKMKLEQGRGLPDEIDLDNYQEAMIEYQDEVRKTMDGALKAARDEAERVRQDLGVQDTLLPVIELDVPPHYVAAQVEKAVERVEYLATAFLGVLWYHAIAKIPIAIEWISSRPLKRFIEEVKATAPQQSRKEMVAKFREESKKAFPDQIPKWSFEVVRETMQVVVEAIKARRQYRKWVAEETGPIQNLMPIPKSLDPRDWAVFLLNRVLFYTYSAVAYVQVLQERDPYISEETKKMRQTVVPAMENIRDELIEELKKMEKQTPPPWDAKELERVRNHGMQEKMTLKEAALILGISNQRVLEGPILDQEIKEAHRAVMRQNHPDTLGSNYLALKINKAKEIITKSGTGNEAEQALYDVEKEERKKMESPEYLANARPASGGADPDADMLARFDQEAAAAMAAKLRAKRKLRSWYWHKVPLWRRVLGLGAEFFPVQKEALRMMDRMRKKRSIVRPEVLRGNRRKIGDIEEVGEPMPYGNIMLSSRASRKQEYMHPREYPRLRRSSRRWIREKSRWFSYWFYWRLSRPIPLLFRIPFFVFVRVPVLLTLYPLAFLGAAMVYPFVLLAKVVKPIPRWLVAPFPPLYRFIRNTTKRAFTLPDFSAQAQEERMVGYRKDFERFKSKESLRRIWRRFSDALYQRANVDQSRPDWDPDVIKKTIREELSMLREGRKAYDRDPKAFADEDDAELAMPEVGKLRKSPAELADEQREMRATRNQSRRRPQ